MSCFPVSYMNNIHIIKAVVVTLFFVSIKFGVMFSFSYDLQCGSCHLFYPSSESAYTDVTFSIIYLVILLDIIFSKPIQIRHSVKKWVIFMILVHVISVISIFLIINSLDFGFCINSLSIIINSSAYSPLLFYIFIEDSSEVVAKSITSGTITPSSDPILYYGNRIKQEKNSIKLLDYEDLKFGAKIGIGGYGEVSHGRWHHTDVAIKRVFQKSGKEEVDDFMKEIKMLSQLNHPNIILFIGACVTNTDVYIITEYMPLGSVYSILHSDLCRTSTMNGALNINIKKDKSQLKLSLNTKINILMDTAKGMLYLHSFRPPIIHRDLKTQNLLVDKFWRVKLCDFGLSRFKSSETMSRLGTLQYSAPEILRGEKYTEKADIYSFGIITWEIITEGIPYDGWPPLRVASDVAYKSRRPDIPSSVLPEIQNLMKNSWDDNENHRLDFSSIIQQLENIKLISQSQTGPSEDDTLESLEHFSAITPLNAENAPTKNYLTIQPNKK
uniref:Protein kinase domain-containing protein n=1 Tax=Arcella intermedia TaxID=1963864 RepID=A0A6B2L2B0_9EUKA